MIPDDAARLQQLYLTDVKVYRAAEEELTYHEQTEFLVELHEHAQTVFPVFVVEVTDPKRTQIAAWGTCQPYANQPGYHRTWEICLYAHRGSQSWHRDKIEELLQTLIEAARERDAHTLLARVDPRDDWHFRVYDRLGFQRVGYLRQVQDLKSFSDASYARLPARYKAMDGPAPAEVWRDFLQYQLILGADVAPPQKKVYVLHGEQITDTEGFYKAIGEAVNGPGGYFGGGLASLNDCFYGGFGTPEEPYIILWLQSELSREEIGAAEFDAIVDVIRGQSRPELILL